MPVSCWTWWVFKKKKKNIESLIFFFFFFFGLTPWNLRANFVFSWNRGPELSPFILFHYLNSFLNLNFDSIKIWLYLGFFIISSVQLLSCVQLFATPWTAAHQASLPITSSQSLLKLMSIESVMPSNHLILCGPLLLPPSIFPSIRVFSRVSCLHQVAKVLEFQLQ